MTERARRRFLRSVAAGVPITIAGCTGVLSGDETTTADYSLPEASPSVEVEMGPNRTNQFAPEIVHVEVGGTVTWTNVSGSHSATAYHPENDQPRRIPEGAESWDSGIFRENGRSFTHAFETPGVYDYYCTPHEPMGMIGTVVVGAPDPANQPGLSAPGDDLSNAARTKIEELNGKVRPEL